MNHILQNHSTETTYLFMIHQNYGKKFFLKDRF